jgi:hypothetical protein
MRSYALLLALLTLAASPLLAKDKDKNNQTMVSFAGALKQVTKKAVVIETGGNNDSLTFIRTKRTRFLNGDRAIDGAAIPQGITVNVEAFEKLNREMEAVTVSVAVSDHSPNK